MLKTDDYTVGWICAITSEHVAARVFLDEEHDPLDVSPNDNNTYTLGKMGKHNVVIAALPNGEYGTTTAATVARDMLHTFTNIRIGLMVGIAGGAPSPVNDIRLGDVVVGMPCNGHGGVFEYDFGKNLQDHNFQTTRFLDQSPSLLRNAVGSLQSDYEMRGHQFQDTISEILRNWPKLRKKYQRPDSSDDRLYRSNIVHPSDGDSPCIEMCGNDGSALVLRSQRGEDSDDPAIHYGLIASGNKLMKNALDRDRLASEKQVLCFEMEAAGLMNHFPCLVIRGICDYSDSHKNKIWQGYAALTAAAYTKDLLLKISPNKIEAEKKIAEIVFEEIKEIKENIVEITHKQRNQEDLNVLNWLTPVNYGPQQSDIFEKRQEGTGMWLLNSDNFQCWLNGKNRALFCPGIPGAGKTVLTSIVINSLQLRFKDDLKIGLAYIYFNYKRHNEQTIKDLLASLLKQLATPQSPLPIAVQHLYDQHKTKRTQPSANELLRALESIITLYSKVFIIIDALDECQSDIREGFLLYIFQLQTRVGAHIFATSRFILSIERKFRGANVQEIRATPEDIDTYLSAQIDQLPSCVKHSQQLQKEITAGISEAIDGMFLLAQIYIQSLSDKLNPNKIKSALKSLKKQTPQSTERQKIEVLNYAYSQAVERIEGQKEGFRITARNALLWITYTKRQLTVAELEHALAVQPGTSIFDENDRTRIQEIVSGCAGLIAIDDESHIIRLVHHTTQEYFQQQCKEWFLAPQSEIGKVCTTYLSYEVFGDGACNNDKAFEARLELYPFYDYASKYWGHHARESSILWDGEIELLQDTPKVNSLCQALMAQKNWWEDTEYSRNFTTMTGLHLAARFGVMDTIKPLLAKGILITSIDSDGWTSLHQAASYGHKAMVALLVDKGANIEAADNEGMTPLCRAADEGHEAVVVLLVDKGANIEAADNEGMTPLCWATEEGHEAVVALLVDKGANIEAADNEGMTPLCWAAEEGHEAVVALLVDKGANIEAADDNRGMTPLCWAAKKGHKAMVALLLDKGANIEAADNNRSMTPLCWAAEKGHEAVVALLVDKGANIEAADDNGGMTLLCWAAEKGHEAVVTLLVDKGTNIEAADDNRGMTPLCWAAGNGHEAVVALLIDKGANIEAADIAGMTPLYWAAGNGHEAVVALLIDKGTNIEAADNNRGIIPLCWAAERGHEAMVALLLKKGANIEAADNRGMTPLCLAAERGHEVMVALLLKKGANIEAADDNRGMTPLCWAAEKGHKAVVALLLDKGANIEAADNNRSMTPLCWAAEKGHEAVVALLVDKGANIEAADNKGITPLCQAAKEGYKAVVALLVDKGANIEAANNKGITSLCQAAMKGHKAMVALLVDKGANIEAADNKGITPLRQAAKRGHYGIVVLLLDKGAKGLGP